MTDHLAYYIRSAGQMRTDAGKSKYPLSTQHRAPHKPIFLLSVLDLFEQGELTTNFVPLSPELADLFASYWELVMPIDKSARLFLPFFHMKNDGFWHLVPHSDKEDVLASIRQIGSIAQLRDTVIGGRFDPELYELICVDETRSILRSTLIEQYFDNSLLNVLLSRTNTNIVAHRYSLKLLEQARSRMTGTNNVVNEAEQPVRDQGFRKAIVKAYDHRCVLCGVRLVTYEGKTAATAAHIIPWSVNHNDDPRNGLCLCRLCHWAFDVGLTTINARYRIRLSEQVGADGNMPGYLSTLNDRPIFEPIEDVFNPAIESLKWHTEKVFLG
jgi:putative restriction endonuclease